MMPRRELEMIEDLEEKMEPSIKTKRYYQECINNIKKYYNMEEFENLLSDAAECVIDSFATVEIRGDSERRQDIDIENLEQIHDHCGVYIYTTMSGKRYIGHSTRVRRRILQHKRIRERIYCDDPIIKVAIFKFFSRGSAMAFEWKLIKELSPELNIKGIGSERELNINNSENRTKLPLDVSLKLSGLNELKEIYLEKIKFIEKEMNYLQNRKYY